MVQSSGTILKLNRSYKYVWLSSVPDGKWLVPAKKSHLNVVKIWKPDTRAQETFKTERICVQFFNSWTIRKLDLNWDHSTQNKQDGGRNSLGRVHTMHFLAVVGCFHVLLVVLLKDEFFLVLYSNSTTYKNMKTLNYNQKVRSVYWPSTIWKLDKFFWYSGHIWSGFQIPV
jgi:hypothetical protein